MNTPTPPFPQTDARLEFSAKSIPMQRIVLEYGWYALQNLAPPYTSTELIDLDPE